MSLNRENITWQSKDGSWNRAFYDFEYVNEDSENFDPEWDVRYDYDRFNWVTTGHATEQQANNAWNGANPGHLNVIEYSKDTKADCDDLDHLARRFLDPAYDKAQRAKEQRDYMRYLGKQVCADYAEKKFYAGLTVNVSYFSGEPGAGIVHTYTGRLVQDGNWLSIEAGGKKLKVYNTKTDKPYLGTRKGQLTAVSAVVPQSVYLGGFGRW